MAKEMLKSEMLTRSTRCFVMGWCSLLPLLGIFPALLAFADFRAVVLGKGPRWNAAKPRLLIGVWLAALGILFSLAVGALLAIVILNKMARG